MPTRTDRASRTISAPPGAIWDAFASPSAWVEWLPPAGMHAALEHFDFRAGGTYRLTLIYDSPSPETQAKASADSDVVEGRFVVIETGHRLVQEIQFPSEDPAYSGTMTMIWLLEPAGAQTLVTITAENVPAGISAEDHQAGMSSTLANLAAYVEARQQAGMATSSSPSS